MIEKIYIVHFVNLKERKEYLTPIISDMDIPYEFIENSETSDSILYEKYDEFCISKNRLSVGEFCNYMSHLSIYQDILKNGYKKCLILEDDAIFTDIFFDNIKSIVDESEEYDFTFLSSCCNLHQNKTSNNFLYESKTSRCACAYIVNIKKLKLIVDNMMPFENVIDFQLNIIKDRIDIKYAWCEPCVFIQGSENKYKSNLR